MSPRPGTWDARAKAISALYDLAEHGPVDDPVVRALRMRAEAAVSDLYDTVVRARGPTP